MAAEKLEGIFCLESDWEPNLRDRKSVAPILDVLERLRIAKTIRRDVATKEELQFYVKKWAQAGYADYKVLYFATHGGHDEIVLGGGSVTLDEIGDVLEGKCKNRVIYFGSCLTLNSIDEELTKFVRRIGATAIVGYFKKVDWLKSAAFEILLLQELVQGKRTGPAIKRLFVDHPRMAAEFGLIAATQSRVYDGSSAEVS